MDCRFHGPTPLPLPRLSSLCRLSFLTSLSLSLFSAADLFQNMATLTNWVKDLESVMQLRPGVDSSDVRTLSSSLTHP